MEYLLHSMVMPYGTATCMHVYKGNHLLIMIARSDTDKKDASEFPDYCVDPSDTAAAIEGSQGSGALVIQLCVLCEQITLYELTSRSQFKHYVLSYIIHERPTTYKFISIQGPNCSCSPGATLELSMCYRVYLSKWLCAEMQLRPVLL